MKKFFCILILISFYLTKSQIVIEVTKFGATPNDYTDDSAAFQKCLDKLVTYGGGTLNIPTGKYLITHLNFFGKKYSNITIQGNNSTIEQIFLTKRHLIERWSTYSLRNAADGCFIFDAQVSKQFDDSKSLKNISILNLNFWTDNKKFGFDELSHQISAHGVSGFKVDNCTFTGFLGDGIAINAGTDFRSNYGAYNKNVNITNCKFDGVTKNNRQGISFYYCDGFIVENCSFENITNEKMPGAIDVEPMDNWQVSRNGIIRKCSFKNIGGVAAVVIFLMEDSEENPIKHSYGYILENCIFDNVRTPLAVIGNNNYLNKSKNANKVIFRNSAVDIFDRFIDARQAYNVYIENVSFNNMNMLGYLSCNNEGYDILFKNCNFIDYNYDRDFCFTKKSKDIIFNNCKFKKKSIKYFFI